MGKWEGGILEWWEVGKRQEEGGEETCKGRERGGRRAGPTELNFLNCIMTLLLGFAFPFYLNQLHFLCLAEAALKSLCKLPSLDLD